MADINQVITLGVGTPASIEHFILVGLNVNNVVNGTAVEIPTRLTLATDGSTILTPINSITRLVPVDDGATITIITGP